MILDFQVAEVSKPRLAVKRIVEKGNRVIFGPGKEDNFIINNKTGDKLMMIPNGRGSYVLKEMREWVTQEDKRRKKEAKERVDNG
eukprot:10551671-Karenia_brevis.AAC.1